MRSDACDSPAVTSRLTFQGAIYATDNGAYSWSAAVQETVDATLNRTVSSGISGASYYEGTFSTIQRSPAGDYVAVSSRGKVLVLHQVHPVSSGLTCSGGHFAMVLLCPELCLDSCLALCKI